MQTNICPSDAKSNYLFSQMLQQPLDELITIMNDDTACDINIIWASIEACGKQWRGHHDLFFPGMPINRKEFWTSFALDHQGSILPLAYEYLQNTSGAEVR